MKFEGLDMDTPSYLISMSEIARARIGHMATSNEQALRELTAMVRTEHYGHFQAQAVVAGNVALIASLRSDTEPPVMDPSVLAPAMATVATGLEAFEASEAAVDAFRSRLSENLTHRS